MNINDMRNSELNKERSENDQRAAIKELLSRSKNNSQTVKILEVDSAKRELEAGPYCSNVC